jgi:hypothetical protein
MDQGMRLLLEPDWPRMRQLLARKMRKSEDEVQAMADRGDSLEKVDLTIAYEEVLEESASVKLTLVGAGN